MLSDLFCFSFLLANSVFKTAPVSVFFFQRIMRRNKVVTTVAPVKREGPKVSNTDGIPVKREGPKVSNTDGIPVKREGPKVSNTAGIPAMCTDLSKPL